MAFKKFYVPPKKSSELFMYVELNSPNYRLYTYRYRAQTLFL